MSICSFVSRVMISYEIDYLEKKVNPSASLSVVLIKLGKIGMREVMYCGTI